MYGSATILATNIMLKSRVPGGTFVAVIAIWHDVYTRGSGPRVHHEAKLSLLKNMMHVCVLGFCVKVLLLFYS